MTKLADSDIGKLFMKFTNEEIAAGENVFQAVNHSDWASGYR
jgi:hypothetical protein